MNGRPGIGNRESGMGRAIRLGLEVLTSQLILASGFSKSAAKSLFRFPILYSPFPALEQ